MGREPVEVALHHAGPDGLETRSRRDDTHRRGSAGASRARQTTPGLDPVDPDRPGRNGPGRAASRLRVGPREAPPAMGQGPIYLTRCRTPNLDHSFEGYRVLNETREDDLDLPAGSGTRTRSNRSRQIQATRATRRSG